MAASAGTRKGDPRLDLWNIYEANGDYVWLSLRRLGVLEADLEDLAHDVFIKAFRNLDSYDATRPVRPWLFGIAMRMAIDYRERAQHRSRQTPYLELERASSQEPLSPEGSFSADETRNLVMRALEDLTMERRTVLVLHELNGHSIPEIAEITGTGESTLYSRLRLARLDLMQAVQKLVGSEQ
jgi:RNA polymerase sigma-70 factor (ECF subfamily)